MGQSALWPTTSPLYNAQIPTHRGCAEKLKKSIDDNSFYGFYNSQFERIFLSTHMEKMVCQRKKRESNPKVEQHTYKCH
jgi:hypothetical protein